MRFKAVILIEWVEGMHRLAGRATLGLVFLSQITKHQPKNVSSDAKVKHDLFSVRLHCKEENNPVRFIIKA